MTASVITPAPDCTPARAIFPQDNAFDSSCGLGSNGGFDTSSFDTSDLDTSASVPSRLVGLGFTALVKDDGSPFDGLGMLTGRLYDNVTSPSDEARARARERRDRRTFGAAIQIRDDLGAKVTPPARLCG